MTAQPDEALGVLRTVWEGQGQSENDIDAACRPKQKVCKNMVHVGFDGYAGEDGDLRRAWRARLAEEGKLNPQGGSLRDLILGSAGSSGSAGAAGSVGSSGAKEAR